MGAGRLHRRLADRRCQRPGGDLRPAGRASCRASRAVGSRDGRGRRRGRVRSRHAPYGGDGRRGRQALRRGCGRRWFTAHASARATHPSAPADRSGRGLAGRARSRNRAGRTAYGAAPAADGGARCPAREPEPAVDGLQARSAALGQSSPSPSRSTESSRSAGVWSRSRRLRPAPGLRRHLHTRPAAIRRHRRCVGLASALAAALDPGDWADTILVTAFTWGTSPVLCELRRLHGLDHRLIVFFVSYEGADTYTAIVDRLVDTLIGGALAMAASSWPTWEGTDVSGRGSPTSSTPTGRSSEPCSAGRPTSPPRTVGAVEDSRLAVRLARSNAEASLERALAEPARAGEERLTSADVMLASRTISRSRSSSTPGSPTSQVESRCPSCGRPRRARSHARGARSRAAFRPRPSGDPDRGCPDPAGRPPVAPARARAPERRGRQDRRPARRGGPPTPSAPDRGRGLSAGSRLGEPALVGEDHACTGRAGARDPGPGAAARRRPGRGMAGDRDPRRRHVGRMVLVSSVMRRSPSARTSTFAQNARPWRPTPSST